MAPKSLLCRAATFEHRNDDLGDGFTLEGYAAVFDTPTRIDSWEGRFDEVIARGAFRKTLSERTPVLQFDHGHDLATGSVPIGSIDEIREDDHGLYVKARLHDNQRVEPIRQAIASGAIDGMSFRFRVLRDDESRPKGADVPLRTIREVELFELGPVVFPAYEATTVGVRSLLADLDPEDRRQLVTAIADELRTDIASDAATPGTSDTNPDAAPQGTSGDPTTPTPGQRERWLREPSVPGGTK